MIDLDQLGYPEFRDYVFYRNVEYHPDRINRYCDSAPGILRHCINLFEEAKELPRLFARDRLFEGFDFISGASGFFRYPADKTSGPELREGFYRSMVPLFTDLFSSDPLEHVAFLWFERMLVWCQDSSGRSTSDDPALRAVMLETEQSVLALQSRNCREAALHGLNHLHFEEPAAVEKIIDDFLRQNPDLDSELAEYAEACRVGRQP